MANMMGTGMNKDISVLLGLTLKSVERCEDYEILFEEVGGRRFKMYHAQYCCESVTIEDVCGNLQDLVGSPILQAEESTNKDGPKKSWGEEYCTWTFYKLATIKGSVTIRWYGTSNGYYSVEVDFEEIT